MLGSRQNDDNKEVSDASSLFRNLGSCGKTQLDELQWIHARAAKKFYGLHWCTLSDKEFAHAYRFSLNDLYKLGLLQLAQRCLQGISPFWIQ